MLYIFLFELLTRCPECTIDMYAAKNMIHYNQTGLNGFFHISSLFVDRDKAWELQLHQLLRLRKWKLGEKKITFS